MEKVLVYSFSLRGRVDGVEDDRDERPLCCKSDLREG